MPPNRAINISLLCWVLPAPSQRVTRKRKLLDYTIEIIEKYFWSEEEQMCLESWDEAFSKTEEYRGGNANMHAVEAFLIVYDVTHDKNGWIARFAWLP